MSVGMEEGVGVAQVAGEEWLGRVRSGVAVPSALGQEDGCMVEDTSVQSRGLLPLHLHFRFLPQHFRILQIHLSNHIRQLSGLFLSLIHCHLRLSCTHPLHPQLCL